MKYRINKVAVLGAGVMGAAIAAHFAGAGITVLLMDIVPKELSKGEISKGLTIEDKLVRNRFSNAGKSNILNPKSRAIYDKDLGRIIETGNFEDDLNKIADCDLVIEVIVEKLEIKKNLMREIAKYRKEGTIITSNTSGVSINAIVSEMTDEFKSHFMGTHFFNPPRYMKLFEIIPCKDTLQEIVDFMTKFAEQRLGKGVIKAKDTPNFIANRIGVQSITSIMTLGKKYNYSIPKIDLLTGSIIGRPKTGTYRLADMVGIDILVHVAENILSNIDNEYEKASNNIPEYVKELYNNGILGDKTKGGFYKKTKIKSGVKRLVWDYNKKEYVTLEREKVDAVAKAKKAGVLKNQINAMTWGESEENTFVWEVMKSTVLYCGNKVPEIADDYKEIDKGMKWGFNWELGPFEVWDAIGVEKSIERMKLEGEEIPAWIEERLNTGKTNFYDNESMDTPYINLNNTKRNQVIDENGGAVLKDIGDGVACLEFKTKGNTITDDIISMIYKSMRTVEEKEYKGLVIANHSKNFSTGANLMLIAEYAKNKEWKKLEKLVHDFQYANMRIKHSLKPVITCAHGMTLGGGAEIAMSGYKQVVHAETYMGLVELGVGLIPGGGGIKEVLCRYSENMGKASVAERINGIKEAWELIAMAKVSGSGHDALKKKYINKNDSIVMNSDYVIDEAKMETIRLYDSGFRPKMKEEIIVTGITGKAALSNIVEYMKEGKFISEYDGILANKVATILTGGNVLGGTLLSEDNILDLEREEFLKLCGESKTHERIEYMLKNGKPLRN
jgi:3-hydroxyacyl-CoA dehydrogenase